MVFFHSYSSYTKSTRGDFYPQSPVRTLAQICSPLTVARYEQNLTPFFCASIGLSFGVSFMIWGSAESAHSAATFFFFFFGACGIWRHGASPPFHLSWPTQLCRSWSNEIFAYLQESNKWPCFNCHSIDYTPTILSQQVSGWQAARWGPIKA